MPFLLRAKLNLSSADIRAVLSFIHNSETFIICGDRNGILFTLRSCPDGSFGIVTAFCGCSRSVSSLAYVKPNDDLPDGAVIVGSHDGTCSLWPLQSLLTVSAPTPPAQLLQQHSKEVCFVGVCDDSQSAITASWDLSARIFPLKRPDAPIHISHGALAIWSVARVANGFVTAGADRSLRLWSPTGRPLSQYADAHGGPIRDAKFIPQDNTLLTVSNDGLLKEWELDGRSIDPIRETVVTNSYLYALAVLNADTRKCATAGDRGFVFVVERGKLADAFPFAEPVWSLAALPDGDLAVGCASGVLAVLTEDAARRAAPELEAAHFESLLARRVPAERYRTANVAALPEFGGAANRKLGQPVAMRARGEAVLGVWVPGYARWVRWGTVGPPRVSDASRREWDAKIEVCVEERRLELFINRGENPWLVARRFIRENAVPMCKMVPLLLLLRANAGEMMGPGGQVAGFDPVFDEPELPPADAFAEGEAPIMGSCEGDSGAVVALLRGRLQRGERCDANGYVRVVRRLMLKRSLPADFVHLFAGMMCGNGSLRDGNREGILLLGDGFKHYPEEMLDVLEREKVIVNGREVVDCLETEAREAFVRLLLNVACFSLDVPARLTEIAATLSALSLKSLTGMDNGDFVRTCHICVQYSPEAIEKLKPEVEKIRKLNPRTDSIRNLLTDLDTKLCQ